MTIAASDKPKPAAAAGWLGRALAWWVGELAGLWGDAANRWQKNGGGLTIEAGERYWMLRRRQQVIGQIDGAGMDAATRRQALRDLVPTALRRRPVVVEIPQERVLNKIVTLPAAARDELDRILEFEIARHFPFPAERVFFRHRVVSPGGAGPVDVELVAVPRETVAAICAEIAGVGLRPSGVAVVGTLNAERLFLPVGGLAARRAGLSWRDRGLLAACGLLALAALAAWPLAQQQRLATLDHDIAALKPRAETALAARVAREHAAARSTAVLRLRDARPPLIGVLDTLTRAIPDGAWLLSLGVDGRAVVLDGLAPSAATTALDLEHSKRFSDIEFRSPITRDPASGLEHFRLGATIAPTTARGTARGTARETAGPAAGATAVARR